MNSIFLQIIEIRRIRFRVVGLTAMLGLCLQTVPVFAGADEVETIEPCDVFTRVTLVHQGIEPIRKEMGRSKSTPLRLEIANVSPREAYFQAITLLKKGDRLCFEFTRQMESLPGPPEDAILPADVLAIVNAALDRIQQVRAKLGIPDTKNEVLRDPTKSPTDVFRAILDTNRQLNVLLDQRFSPADVYQQVTFATSYASRLLTAFPGSTRIPGPPPFEPRKRPADVYLRLAHCFEMLTEIARISGVEMLDLKLDSDLTKDVTPSDVYDFTSIIVSELAFLHRQLGDGGRAQEAYYPGRKLPSHVYQRAGILEAQLAQLLSHVELEPSWLRGGGSP